MSERKTEHIKLAEQSQTDRIELDNRFYYEPVLSAHPNNSIIKPIKFAGKTMRYPIWISSITGDTDLAKKINTNLAKAANEFGLGMALGSCRCLLENDDCIADFNMRDIIGNQPFYANLGIAQIEKIVKEKNYKKVKDLISKLQADGLFIHINPLQEIYQPEGDRITIPPIKTLSKFIDNIKTNIFVKEVGQGFGPKSLEALFKLNIQGIEFAAFGGTNFTKLEMIRENNLSPILNVGHNIDEMIEFYKDILILSEKNIIISGGIKSYLDGYYYINKISTNTVYGQAYNMLKHAAESYDALKKYLQEEIKGLELAYTYLTIK
jgi:isopentenyl-diphosphate delta-isomerase